MYDFSYRFNAIVGIGGYNGYAGPDETEIKKQNSKLTSFDCLEEQFDKLESAYINATKKSENIRINVIPAISGIYELGVHHKIKRNFFSRAIKVNCYYIHICKIISENKICDYACQTDDINRVKQIFKDFYEKRVAPDLTDWEITFIS